MKIGSKVVCLFDYSQIRKLMAIRGYIGYPKKGEIYTVSNITQGQCYKGIPQQNSNSKEIYIDLLEMGSGVNGFHIEDFRELDNPIASIEYEELQLSKAIEELKTELIET